MGNKDMELIEYKKLFVGLPKPSENQTENFIDFVANDHSWYKHLTDERKEPFIFYLDPNAGKTLEKFSSKGFFKKVEHFKFLENKHNYYLIRYGCWQYFTTKYTANFIPNSNGSIRDSRPFIGLQIIDKEGKSHKLPEAIIKQGEFLMSRFLHKSAFESAHSYFDNDGISYAGKHKDLIAELRQHLNSILKFIYNEV